MLNVSIEENETGVAELHDPHPRPACSKKAVLGLIGPLRMDYERPSALESPGAPWTRRREEWAVRITAREGDGAPGLRVTDGPGWEMMM